MFYVWIAILVYLTGSCQAIYVTNEAAENDTLVYEKWLKIDNELKGSINSAVKYLMPYVVNIGTNANVSSTCLRQGLQLIGGIKRLETWALSFVDATGKIMDGLLSSTVSSLGDYSQCLDSVASRKIEDREVIRFRGQYCLLKIKPPLPVAKKEYFSSGIEDLKNYTKSASDLIHYVASKAHNFYESSWELGLCVPSGCSVDDVNNAAKYALSEVYFDAHIEHCETKTRTILKARGIMTISIYSSLGLLMLIGTLLELRLKEEKIFIKNKAVRIIAAFSLLKNIRDLLKLETSKHTISCLSGLRFLTMTWIVSAHTYFFVLRLFEQHQNLDEIVESNKGFGMQIMINFLFSVDTFFFMGGLLNCYVYVKDEEEGRSRSLIYSIKHKLWRTWPVCAAVLISVFLLRTMITGPVAVSHFNKSLEEACETDWWKNLLFINNFAKFDNTCVPQSWYLSAEFQLFLVASVTIRILWRYPKLGLILNFSMVLISAAYSISWTELHGMHATYITTSINPHMQLDVFWSWYTQAMVHAGPYFMGVLVGYMLAKKKEIEISKVFLVFGWLLATFMATSIILATKRWNSGIEPTQLEDIFYSGFSKIAFALSIAWIIICCARGYGGFINEFLSWKVWTPLSRMVFCQYLISPFVQMFSLGTVRTLREASTKEWVWRFFGDYFVSAFFAFLFFVIVENPFVTLEKIINEKTKNGKTDNPKVLQINSLRENDFKVEVKSINGVHLLRVNAL